MEVLASVGYSYGVKCDCGHITRTRYTVRTDKFYWYPCGQCVDYSTTRIEIYIEIISGDYVHKYYNRKFASMCLDLKGFPIVPDETVMKCREDMADFVVKKL